jgi:antitoxin component YwqK of YwqJK toxin-antitoxin module
MKIITIIIALLFTVNIYAQEEITHVFKYYENGNRKEMNSYYDGKLWGECFVWDSAGLKTAEAHYYNGLKDGQWKIWHENGQLAYLMKYRNGQKVGVWKVYDREGNLVGTKDYGK